MKRKVKRRKCKNKKEKKQRTPPKKMDKKCLSIVVLFECINYRKHLFKYPSAVKWCDNHSDK